MDITGKPASVISTNVIDEVRPENLWYSTDEEMLLKRRIRFSKRGLDALRQLGSWWLARQHNPKSPHEGSKDFWLEKMMLPDP